MRDSALTQPPTADEKGTQQLLLAAGTAFGLVYGLSFALLVWGYDALLLSSLSADLAWGKLLLGLPLTVLICILVGRRAVAASGLTRFLAFWPITNGLLGAAAAYGVLIASNLLVWIIDPRFRLLPIFPYGRPDAVRTGFIVLIQIVLGATVGLTQNLAIDWAWDRATPAGRLSWRSWAVMLLCIPLAIFPALALNELIHRPLRTPQQALSDFLDVAVTATAEEAEAAGVSLNVVRGLRDNLSEGYVTHLVGFDPDSESWFSANVDAAFDSNLLMRCLTFGASVVHCHDLSELLTGWMDDLIRAGLSGARPWEETGAQALVVDDDVVTWLTSHRHRLSQEYTVSRSAQRGGWILMSAQFDTGFEMGCYFRGARPVVVDHCAEMPAAPAR